MGELGHKESWVSKNWCFWTVVLKKALESPLDSKEIQPVHPKGNQSWVFIGRLRRKLKLQYFGYLVRRTDSLEKTLMLGKIEGRRRDDRGWDGWMASPTQWTWVCVNSGSWGCLGRPGVLQFMGCRVGHDWATELNWEAIGRECDKKNEGGVCGRGDEEDQCFSKSTFWVVLTFRIRLMFHMLKNKRKVTFNVIKR